jgi:transcriptional regulator with XRE-family HTH domain
LYIRVGTFLTGRELAERVRTLRESKGLSAIQLADRAQIAHSYIALIEAGQQRLPPRAIMARLAKALGVSEKRLLEDR